MPMTRQLWSISGLSAELGIDRRTLSKKLSDLRPDGEGIEGGKTVRRWYMARVLKHLKAADRTTAKAEVDERLIEDHKHVVTQFLFPALVSSRYFLGFFAAYLHEDIGLRNPKPCGLTRPRSSHCTMRSASSSPGLTRGRRRAAVGEHRRPRA
jgi:hypothetical protein